MSRIGIVAKELNIPINACVVVDDSVKFVEETRRIYGSEIFIVGVAYTDTVKRMLKEAGADIVVDDLISQSLRSTLGIASDTDIESRKTIASSNIETLLADNETIFARIESMIFPNLNSQQAQILKQAWEDVRSGKKKEPVFRTENDRIAFEQIRCEHAFNYYREDYEAAKKSYLDNINILRHITTYNVYIDEDISKKLQSDLVQARDALRKAIARIVLFNNLFSREKYFYTLQGDDIVLVQDGESSSYSLSNSAIFKILNAIDINRDDVILDPYGGAGNHLLFLSLEKPAAIIASDIRYGRPDKPDDKKYALAENQKKVMALFDFLPDHLRPQMVDITSFAANAIKTPLTDGMVTKIITDPSYGRRDASDEGAAFMTFIASIPEQFRVIKNSGEVFAVMPMEWVTFLRQLLKLKQKGSLDEVEAYELFKTTLNSSAYYANKGMSFNVPFDREKWSETIRIISSHLFFATDKVDGKNGFVFTYEPIKPVSFYPAALMHLVKKTEGDVPYKDTPPVEVVKNIITLNQPLVSTELSDGLLGIKSKADNNGYRMPLSDIRRRDFDFEEDYSNDLENRRIFLERITGRPLSQFARVSKSAIPINKCISSTPFIYNPWRVLRFLTTSDKELKIFLKNNPPVVIKMGEKYFVSEGRHRMLAYQLRGMSDIEAVIIEIQEQNSLKLIMDAFDSELPQKTEMGSGRLAANFLRWLKDNCVKYNTKDSSIDVDIGMMNRLSTDLIYSQLHEDRTYEVKYDTSRLTTSQIEIIEEYVRLLQLRSSNSNSIKLRPFSSIQGSKESLIAVYCTGKNFKGEGHVDVTIPDGELKDYLLRITGMINIALASSNIPDNLSREEVDKYRPIMSYIKNQYKAILGEELAIPDSPEDILKVIRRIVLGLPKSMRMNTNQIEEYNRLAKEALTAA